MPATLQPQELAAPAAWEAVALLPDPPPPAAPPPQSPSWQLKLAGAGLHWRLPPRVRAAATQVPPLLRGPVTLASSPHPPPPLPKPWLVLVLGGVRRVLWSQLALVAPSLPPRHPHPWRRPLPPLPLALPLPPLLAMPLQPVPVLPWMRLPPPGLPGPQGWLPQLPTLLEARERQASLPAPVCAFQGSDRGQGQQKPHLALPPAFGAALEHLARRCGRLAPAPCARCPLSCTAPLYNIKATRAGGQHVSEREHRWLPRQASNGNVCRPPLQLP